MKSSVPTSGSTLSPMPEAEALGAGQVGDLLLTFPAESHARIGRAPGNDTIRLHDHSTWSLWAQPQSARWRGHPLTTLSTPPWRAWVLGEVFGEAGSAGPSERIRSLLAGQAADRLNGHFLVWAWNEQTRRWHLWTDRFGTLHAYYATDGRYAALGTFMPAVAAIASRRRPDWIGLASFCALGFFAGDLTYFEDVRILRPASEYVFSEDGHLLSQARYWNWRHAPDRARSYGDAVAEFGEIFGAVVREQTRSGRIAVPISGGLDSRSTVAALPADTGDGRLWSYSYGYEAGSVEIRIARQVARRQGLKFREVTISPYLFGRLTEILGSVEGFQEITQCRQAAVSDLLRRDADRVIAAHWGDVWLGDMGLAAPAPKRLCEEELVEHALRRMEKKGGAWLLSEVCRAGLGSAEPRGLVRDRVREEMRRIPEMEDPDFRVKAFKTDQWSFRWTTASLRMYQAAAFPRLPFYDTRLADFFCTLPSHFTAGRRLQIDYLKRIAPDLARVTWQGHDADLFQYQRRNSWLLPRRALRKAWRGLTRVRPIERNWEIQFLSERGRQGLEDWLLRPGLRLHDWTAPGAIRSLLDSFYAEPRAQGRGYTLSMLLTLSAWLEQYG